MLTLEHLTLLDSLVITCLCEYELDRQFTHMLAELDDTQRKEATFYLHDKLDVLPDMPIGFVNVEAYIKRRIRMLEYREKQNELDEAYSDVLDDLDEMLDGF